MTKLFLFFSHEITEKQKIDAKESYDIKEFITLPEELQYKWSNIPADLDSIKEFLLPFKKWLTQEASKGDYMLIQGEFGAVYFIVNWAFENGLIPIYSTTERKSKEVSDGEKIKSVKIFEHKRFRKYESWS